MSQLEINGQWRRYPMVGDFYQLKAEFRSPFDENGPDGGARKHKVIAVQDNWIQYETDLGYRFSEPVIAFVSARDWHHNDVQMKVHELDNLNPLTDFIKDKVKQKAKEFLALIKGH